MSKFCDNCEFKKKVKFSTMFKCERYNKILKGNPSVALDECDMKEPTPIKEEPPHVETMEPVTPEKGKKSRKKDFIEVK